MAFWSSTCQSVFPNGSNVGRPGIVRTVDSRSEVAKFSMVIPLGVTRANVLAPTLNPPSAVRLDGVAIVKSARESPDRDANRAIEVRKL